MVLQRFLTKKREITATNQWDRVEKAGIGAIFEFAQQIIGVLMPTDLYYTHR